MPVVGCYWMVWDPDAASYPDTGAGDYSCGPGEIRRLSTGLRFDSLEDALAHAELVDGFCLGDGDHHVASLNWEPGSGWGAASSLRLVGNGLERTSLVGEITAASPGYSFLTLDIDGRVAIEGLHVEGLALRVLADQAASLTDLSLGVLGGMAPLLTVNSPDMQIDGLTVHGARLEAGSPIVLYGSGMVRGLVLTDNLLMAGQLLQVHQQIVLLDPVISGNVAVGDEIGAVAIQAYGELRILGGQLTDNSVSGPLIYASTQLELEGVELSGNSGSWQGVVEIAGHALVSGGVVQDNVAGAGVLGVTEHGSLQLDGVDFGLGAQANYPCDVAALYNGDLLTRCIGDELGQDASASCDSSGCD